MTADRRVKQMFALLRHAQVSGRDERLALMAGIVHRGITSASDLSSIEVQAVVDTLDYWKRLDELPQRCASMIELGMGR